ncbi:hypothetical protein AD936_13120 [Gluconobacter japonicus]|nr:hypothetical protein AD936_13120 [Gluconobacter japonicus]
MNEGQTGDDSEHIPPSKPVAQTCWSNAQNLLEDPDRLYSFKIQNISKTALSIPKRRHQNSIRSNANRDFRKNHFGS